MVTKPWYVKKPPQIFVRHKNQRAMPSIAKKTVVRKEIRLRSLRKIEVFSPAVPPHPRKHRHGDWQRHGLKSLAPPVCAFLKLGSAMGKEILQWRSSRISHLEGRRQAGIGATPVPSMLALPRASFPPASYP
jgi:hypothetical protein